MLVSTAKILFLPDYGLDMRVQDAEVLQRRYHRAAQPRHRRHYANDARAWLAVSNARLCCLEHKCILRGELGVTSSTAVAAPTSIGSPREVPVPCISSCPMLSADVDDRRIVLAMSACWDGPFGAVSELDRPSWLTPLPDINADASEMRSTCFATCTTPQHSPRPYPSADASRVLHRPSLLAICAADTI